MPLQVLDPVCHGHSGAEAWRIPSCVAGELRVRPHACFKKARCKAVVLCCVPIWQRLSEKSFAHDQYLSRMHAGNTRPAHALPNSCYPGGTAQRMEWSYANFVVCRCCSVVAVACRREKGVWCTPQVVHSMVGLVRAPVMTTGRLLLMHVWKVKLRLRVLLACPRICRPGPVGIASAAPELDPLFAECRHAGGVAAVGAVGNRVPCPGGHHEGICTVSGRLRALLHQPGYRLGAQRDHPLRLLCS